MMDYLHKLATDRLNGFPHNVIKLLLWMCSGLFCCIVVFRRFFYRMGILESHRLPRPVISVGNLTVGGTGKTPVIEFIMEAMRSRKRPVAVLTRGYMHNQKAHEDAQSDEAQILQDVYPESSVLVGTNRLANAQKYLKQHSTNMFMLDDGFQHLKIKRDLDIVVIDAMNPWGNGWLMPRGILREPIGTLKHADIMVLTKTDVGSENIGRITETVNKYHPGAMIVQSVHQPVTFIDIRTSEMIDLDKAKANEVYAVSGIGSPQSFERNLKDLGAQINEHWVLPDHHVYTKQDIARIASLCAKRNLTVVTTEKDAVKIRRFMDDLPAHIQILSLRIRLKITSREEAFLERIYHIL